jgi:hypothetical protein
LSGSKNILELQEKLIVATLDSSVLKKDMETSCLLGSCTLYDSLIETGKFSHMEINLKEILGIECEERIIESSVLRQEYPVQRRYNIKVCVKDISRFVPDLQIEGLRRRHELRGVLVHKDNDKEFFLFNFPIVFEIGKPINLEPPKHDFDNFLKDLPEECVVMPFSNLE